MRWLIRMVLFIVGAVFGWGAFAADGGTGGQQGAGAESGGGQQGAGGEGGQQDQGQGQQQQARFTEADLERARTEERTKLEATKETERKKAQEKELAEQNKFKELADQRGTELEELRGKAALADSYGEHISGLVDDEIKDWPAEVKALDPGKDNLTARLDWLKKSRPLAAKLATTVKPANTEAGAGSRQAGGQGGQGGQQGQGSQGAGQGQGQGGQQQSQRYRFQQPGDVSW